MGFEPTTPFGAPDFETRRLAKKPRKTGLSLSTNSTDGHFFRQVTDQITDRKFRDMHPPPAARRRSVAVGSLRVQSRSDVIRLR
jgi:hypothetical protein